MKLYREELFLVIRLASQFGLIGRRGQLRLVVKLDENPMQFWVIQHFLWILPTLLSSVYMSLNLQYMTAGLVIIDLDHCAKIVRK